MARHESDPAFPLLGDHFGVRRSIEAELEAKIEEYGVSARKKRWEHLTPEFLDKQAEEYTYDEISATVKARRETWLQKRLGQERATVRIRSRDPILVTAIGDVHFGSVFTDHERFERDIQRIKENPGQYCVLMSNLIDNAIPGKHPDAMLANEVHPEEQVIAMRQKIKELDDKGKVLGAITSPCHEGAVWKLTGQDINRLLFEGRKFPVIDNGGELELEVGDQTYRMALYHQVGRFESQLNKNNAMLRMQQLRHQDADIMVGAHRHLGEALHTYRGEDQATRKDIVCLRTGTYKLDDKWLKQRGFGSGEPGGQSVMLWPDEKRMQPFLDPETATKVHRAVKVERELEEMGLLEKVKRLLR